MVFVACGLNHQSAPLAIREQVTWPEAMHHQLLRQLLTDSAVNEAVILSTCNRTEIYCKTTSPDLVSKSLLDSLNLSHETIAPHWYHHEGHEGIRHAIRVASGLDSMILGEPQIFGQMKQALQKASELGAVKSSLRSTFDYIFNVSKRIRHDSGIGKNPISVAYAGAIMIQNHFPDLSSLKTLMIGAGETATLVTKYLQKAGVSAFYVASRDKNHAQVLADKINGTPVSIHDLTDVLKEVDIVISATACPLPFIHEAQVREVMKHRPNHPILLVDLAVPRDIESAVGLLEGVTLYNIDDLQSSAEQGLYQRQQAAIEASVLIDGAIETYQRETQALLAKDFICDYRQQMENLASLELQRSLNKLAQGICQKQVVEELSNRLVSKLVHQPTTRLRQAASEGRDDLLSFAHYLFNDSRVDL